MPCPVLSSTAPLGMGNFIDYSPLTNELSPTPTDAVGYHRFFLWENQKKTYGSTFVAKPQTQLLKELSKEP